MRIAIEDLVSDLELIHDAPVDTAELPAPECLPGEIHLLVLGHEHDEDGNSSEAELDEQEFSIEETLCRRGGRRVVLRGGSPLSSQWAVYDLLMTLGVRYFHPEHTWYPPEAKWPESLSKIEGPSFMRRSMSAHRTHPIELSAPNDPGELDMEGYQKRWIDWNVKLRQSAVNGWDSEFAGTYAYERGFPRMASFRLLNTQQGGERVLDPDDPRSEEEQIAAAIEEEFQPVEGVPDVSELHFQFNPSEFTEADDEDTVRRLTFIADYIEAEHPGVSIYTINHGTHGEPTPNYGVRFYDLPQFAPGAIGVKVHTLMFYDLERPAPVYGNEDFSYLLDWTLEQHPHRRILHYPESSWWLTFDLPVPLYLAPVTLEARRHDIDLLQDYLSEALDDETGIYGHHLFTSGQEWGYWLIDYCTAWMAWDTSITHTDCIADFTGTLAGGDRIASVLQEVEERQVTDMRDPEIIRYLVGSDDETEVALDVGIDFHPLPPGPARVLDYTDEAVAGLRSSSLDALRAIAADYHEWADAVEETLPKQSEWQAPWAWEIHDGLRIFALRAEHSLAVYETALSLRDALAASDMAAVSEAATGLEVARDITERAKTIVRAREAEYRYPDELTIVGDEPGEPGAIQNATIYPYRYLSRTHRMFYWERPNDQLGTLFGEGMETVRVERRILEEGDAVEISILADEVSDLRIDWGDGNVSHELEAHVYEEQGFHGWVLDATTESGVVHHVDDAVVVERRMVFPNGSLTVEWPEEASLVGSLMPGFIVGLGDDGAKMMALGRVDGETPVAAHQGVQRRDRAGMVSGPADLALSLQNVGDLLVHDAVLTVGEGAGSDERTLLIEGEMMSQDIIDLLVGVGGFDQDGARKLVADVLGYTPDTLPEAIDFGIFAEGYEEP